MLIRAGATMVVQMHYTTNGTPQTDRTKIGLFLAKEAPKVEMRMGTLVNGKLDIPAGEADYSIAAEMTTTADVTLRQMLPHTHLRGKSWEYTATYPDGRSEVILAVPKYDFNWQTDYVFAEADQAAEGHEDPRRRALRQFDGQQVEPRSPSERLVGRSDVGRNDVHGVRLFTRWRRAPHGHHDPAKRRASSSQEIKRSGQGQQEVRRSGNK